MEKKRIAILGSTGSIGRQTLDVVRQHPDRFEVEMISAGGNAPLLVEQARALAKPGDTVLLSPACASFDAFRNFEERGDAFRAIVESFS